MQLIDMRTEVQAHGAAQTISQINRYLNKSYLEVVRRVNYYVDEATYDFTTVSGTVSYPQPADLARDRDLRHTSFTQVLQSAGLKEIDRSPTAQGIPLYYAVDAKNLHLYPTPDAEYPLELRYWLLPGGLVNDTDQPTIPDDYCEMLIYGALGDAFAAEDDFQAAQYWEAKFEKTLSRFQSDQKFPDADMNTQIADFWSGPRTLGSSGWRQ